MYICMHAYMYVYFLYRDLTSRRVGKYSEADLRGDGRHRVILDLAQFSTIRREDASLVKSLKSFVEDYPPTSKMAAMKHADMFRNAFMFCRSVWDVLSDADRTFSYMPPHCFLDGFLPQLTKAKDKAEQVKWQKNLTCWPMAKFLRQDSMPDIPAGLEGAIGSSFHFPLVGAARRHFRNLLASRDSEKRPTQVMWAILQGVGLC